MKRKRRSPDQDDRIDPKKWGVSFSIKQCHNFGIDHLEALEWLLKDAKFRRFRLMSYWNEHEKEQGKYDFSALDAQIALIEKYDGEVTLCLGARQPRWPENHWPDWAWKADKDDRSEALLKYISKVVDRYRDKPVIGSWQLENEALLKSFGERPEVNRRRLRSEFNLVHELDAKRPVIMSTSNSWGIPLRKPIPDIVGFSYYHVYYDSHARTYKRAGLHYKWMHKLRARIIRLLWRRKSFIHELQCEPWGPTAIWKMSVEEQNNSMSAENVAQSIALGKKTKLYPIDMWGAEWWYWRLKKHDDPSVWQSAKQAIKS